MNPFRQFREEFRAARYLQQAERLEVLGKVWLTQAELWRHDATPISMIGKAQKRGEHLLGWAGHLRTEAAELKGSNQ